jgi:hypothetical protein
MKKKLKIQFWKAEHALVMQILEQEGLPKNKEEGTVLIMGHPDLYSDSIYLRGSVHEQNLKISIRKNFVVNSDRDIYLNKITQAITDELFTDGDSELKVGEMCEVNDCSGGDWCKRKLIAILPDNYHDRFIVESEMYANDWFHYRYARPLYKQTLPKVETKGNGDIVIYTWDEE